jgi:hypothetical protein
MGVVGTYLVSVYKVVRKTSDQVTYFARAVDRLPCHVDELWLPFHLDVL